MPLVILYRAISAKVAFEVMYAASRDGLLKSPKAVAAMSASNEALMNYIESSMWQPGDMNTPEHQQHSLLYWLVLKTQKLHPCVSPDFRPVPACKKLHAVLLQAGAEVISCVVYMQGTGH